MESPIQEQRRWVNHILYHQEEFIPSAGIRANLAIPQDHNVEISTLLPMPNISMGLGNDFLTLNDYNFFFTGDGSVEQGNQARYLSDSDKQRFKQLFDQGNSIHTGIAFSLFGISINAGREIGSFAFSINDRMAARGAPYRLY